MENFKGNFQNLFWFLVVCLAFEHVSARQALIRSSDDSTDSHYASLAAPKPTAKRFEPLVMEFPDTERSAKEAQQYKEEKMNSINPRARKEDKNLKMTAASCARGLGDLYKVVSDENKLLYQVCFDDDRSSAIYSEHTIDLANKELEHSSHLGFKALYTLYGQKIDEKYQAAKQTNKFRERFGKGMNITDADIKKMNYFSRNHLTPHADFPLAAEQTLTYFFHNCVPGKQSMNQGNWSTLEDLVRAISTQMGKILHIFTGVYGILMEEDTDGDLVEVYLDQPMNSDQKNIEVPLVIWKLVIDQKTNDSVAFFTSNDNDMNEQQVAQFRTLCPSVCDELGYNFKQEPKSGITLCCKYNDFVKHIKFLPIELYNSQLLKNTVRLDKLNAKPTKSKKVATSDGETVNKTTVRKKKPVSDDTEEVKPRGKGRKSVAQAA